MATLHCTEQRSEGSPARLDVIQTVTVVPESEREPENGAESETGPGDITGCENGRESLAKDTASGNQNSQDTVLPLMLSLCWKSGS